MKNEEGGSPLLNSASPTPHSVLEEAAHAYREFRWLQEDDSGTTSGTDTSANPSSNVYQSDEHNDESEQPDHHELLGDKFAQPDLEYKFVLLLPVREQQHATARRARGKSA
jgi:hypothetical protein